MARSALLNVMVQAVLKAGRGLARDFGEVENLQVSLKGPGDFVSAADRRADQVLIAELRKARPGYAFLTEESGAVAGTDDRHRWIIDPLDGTTNFLHGIPLFAISLGLERDGEVVAGVIFNPILNELYVAERGSGAFLNDRRMRVAARRRLADALIGTNQPHHGHPGHESFTSDVAKLTGPTAGVRHSGTAALDLAWIASGRYDGYWQRGTSPWDVAAGIVLIRESGGAVSDTRGGLNPLYGDGIVAGNDTIHPALVAELNGTKAA